MDYSRLSVLYADIFDYPLTPEELREWAICTKRIFVPKNKKYFFIKKKNVFLRQERAKFQKEKWAIAQTAADILLRIPTIQLVGVTGGLSMNNAKREDDIDLFIIANSGTLWITRLLSLFALIKIRRKRNDPNVSNKICLNMFMTEDKLEVPEHDLFAAHEVLQMKPLWQRKNTYHIFLNANSWVKLFLPNAWELKCQMINDKWPIKKQKFSIWNLAFSIAEPFAKNLQLCYMNKHRTNEVITDTTLRFHPRDARVWIKQKLGVRLARYHIPLDKVFYAR